MIFLADAAFALELIALALGVILLSCSFNKEEKCVLWVKKVGSIIILFSILGMICTGYYATKYWLQGSFETLFSISAVMLNEMTPKAIEKKEQITSKQDMEQKESSSKSHSMEHLQNMGNIEKMEIPKEPSVHH